mmetsp:Transcript_9782/g.36497  ORF Transcript_9782/g.36497 Transcript_9782/m.36497 type:complete len:293 (-) Transcript_9782:174-1052(-)
MSSLTQLSSNKVFGGTLTRYSHHSQTVNGEMKFHIFIPNLTEKQKKKKTLRPLVLWLSGLTCTDENFVQKAGAFRVASELGLVLVAPDTSPREIPDELKGDSWDFGVGAGFYLDATKGEYSKYFNMYSYITKELIDLLKTEFSEAVDVTKRSIMGHSMGGLGALNVGLKAPKGTWASISAFAPICNPSHDDCPWGNKAFSGYLKSEKEWVHYDPTYLVKTVHWETHILIDQGTSDKFLSQLMTDNFREAVSSNHHVKADIRMQEGYDHSYYFISTFIEDHLRFHAKHLHAHA